MEDWRLFRPPAELNPLLHTWTLSVEEQFYFVFPIAIVLGIFLAKNIGKGAGIILVAGTSVSFALAMFTPAILKIDATELLGFYSPITRAWEFGFGALIAWWLLVKPPTMTTSLARLAYMAGLLLVAAGFTSISATEHFPGPVTLLPAVGTALLILSGQFTPWGVGRDPLRSNPAVKIGDLSYSIYLWHWPFIVITSLLWPENPGAVALSAFLSIIPAIGSYYLLEQPIRYGHFPTTMKKTLFVGLTIATPVAIAGTAGYIAESVEARISYSADRPIGYELGCHGPGLVKDSLSVCEFGQDPGVPVYLVGDSHAAHFTEGILEATTEAGLPLSVFTASSCPLLSGVYYKEENSIAGGDCAAWQDKALDHLGSSNPGVVILAASDRLWLEELTVTSEGRISASITAEKLELFEIGLQRALERIVSAGHTVVLVQSVPAWTGFDWRLDRCTLADTLAGCNQEMPVSVPLRESAGVRQILERQGDAVGATIVDFLTIICEDGLCETHQDGIAAYRDSHHITNDFSAQLAPEWKKILEQAGARS